MDIAVTIEALQAEVKELRMALDLLAGLHPELTTNDPAVMAERIFNAVLAEQAASARRIKELGDSVRLLAAQARAR